MKKRYPMCFSSRQQYDLWQSAALLCPTGNSSFCTDCTPEHQQKMIACHRCAYPATSFHGENGNPLFEGRRQITDQIEQREVA